MPDILDFLARTHRPWSHARGRAGTALLLREIELWPGGRALEIGFGTGQTLVEVAANWPKIQLFGLEKSPRMLHAARRRLRFCGLKKRVLVSLLETSTLPYPDGFFDLVYAESVLGILPDDAIAGLFGEIFRVLRPGGVFLNNESLWRNEVPAETRQEINCRCRAFFGIQQAPERFATPEDWCALAEQTGLRLEKQWNMHGLEIPTRRRFHFGLLRSALFSAWGQFKSRFSPALAAEKKALRDAQQSFADYAPFLEGVLFRFLKD